jgi:polysaccharide pyruvyl transferase WcaK-like protein
MLSSRSSSAASVASLDEVIGSRRAATVQKIGLFGLMGIGNFGNDASLEAVLSKLRVARPDAEFVCICGNPDKVAECMGVAAVPINWRPKGNLATRLHRWILAIPREILSIANALRLCRKLDVLIVPGTGILDDFGTGPKGMPYWLLRWSTVARLCGTKLLFVSIGAGPIHHPLSRWLMLRAAVQANYRSYRDEISRDYMAKLGCDVSRDAVYPDVVFGLAHPIVRYQRQKFNCRIVIGIGLMSYNGWRGDTAKNAMIYDVYMSKLRKFVVWLVEQGYDVRIFMGDDGDRDALEDLSSRIRESMGESLSQSITVTAVQSLRDVLEEIARSDLVVATRFHNVVAALAMGRPVLSIGYARKNDVLLTESGMSDLCQHIEHLDLDRLKQQFQLMVKNREVFAESAARMSASAAVRLEEQYRHLMSEFL